MKSAEGWLNELDARAFVANQPYSPQWALRMLTFIRDVQADARAPRLLHYYSGEPAVAVACGLLATCSDWSDGKGPDGFAAVTCPSCRTTLRTALGVDAKPEPVTHAAATAYDKTLCDEWLTYRETPVGWVREQLVVFGDQTVTCPKCRTALGLDRKPVNHFYDGPAMFGANEQLRTRVHCGAVSWHWTRSRPDVTCPACRAALGVRVDHCWLRAGGHACGFTNSTQDREPTSVAEGYDYPGGWQPRVTCPACRKALALDAKPVTPSDGLPVTRAEFDALKAEIDRLRQIAHSHTPGHPLSWPSLGS